LSFLSFFPLSLFSANVAAAVRTWAVQPVTALAVQSLAGKALLLLV
jgi:hypothetical protein